MIASVSGIDGHPDSTNGNIPGSLGIFCMLSRKAGIQSNTDGPASRTAGRRQPKYLGEGVSSVSRNAPAEIDTVRKHFSFDTPLVAFVSFIFVLCGGVVFS